MRFLLLLFIVFMGPRWHEAEPYFFYLYAVRRYVTMISSECTDDVSLVFDHRKVCHSQDVLDSHPRDRRRSIESIYALVVRQIRVENNRM